MKLAQIKKELDLLHIERKRLVNGPQSADNEIRISSIQKQIDELLAAKVHARGDGKIITKHFITFIDRETGMRKLMGTSGYIHPDLAKRSLSLMAYSFYAEELPRIDPVECYAETRAACRLFIDDPECPFQKKNPDHFK